MEQGVKTTWKGDKSCGDVQCTGINGCQHFVQGDVLLICKTGMVGKRNLALQYMVNQGG